ncbi:MarR family transcriptional regulator [bacterium]|nr:MarR family transcriptional regulator [bacterium]
MPVQLRTTEASETWRALITAFTRVNGVLADEMDAETEVSLERYGILLMLSQAKDAAMRPSDLADGLRLSRSGTTRLIDRLEREGLVERRSCDTDGRGSLVALTPEGEGIFRTAGRVHLRGIDKHLGAHLTGEDMAQLRRILTKLAEAVDGDALASIGTTSDRS